MRICRRLFENKGAWTVHIKADGALEHRIARKRGIGRRLSSGSWAWEHVSAHVLLCHGPSARMKASTRRAFFRLELARVAVESNS